MKPSWSCRGRRGLSAAGLATWCWAVSLLPAAALGPHEILLLVNANSPRSKQIANHYARLRKVPPQNVVYLPLAKSVLEAAAEISPADFSKFVLQPAAAIARGRGLDDHILAWVYSADFPLRVTTSPPMSIQGITLTRGTVPDADAIQKGSYVSLLFAGPDQPGGPMGSSHALDQFRERFPDAMPLPSMLLAVTGSRGTDVETALRVLGRGAAADRTAPRGTVYFVVSDDVRSRCRQWQFSETKQELAGLRVVSVITSNFPAGRTDVLGVLSAGSWVHPETVGSFVPGAMGEHLTSFGGMLDNWDQTKLTEWLRAGASASAGTVTEPLSNWRKFPHSRLFVHYAAGCTLLESFYQSIKCPLQILLVGDPLACPWTPPLSLVLVRVDDGSDPAKLSFHAELFPPSPQAAPEYRYYLDGRLRPGVSGTDAELNTAELADGYHELRVVAYLPGSVRHQAFAVQGFSFSRKGRSARLEGVAGDGKIDLVHPLKVRVSGEGKPSRVAVMSGEETLAEAAGESAELAVEPTRFGLGPNRLQAVAAYDDGETVRGEPVPVEVVRLNQAPVISGVRSETNADKRVVLVPDVSDPETDPIAVDWFRPVDVSGASAGSGSLEATGDGLKFSPSTNAFDVAVFQSSPLEGASEVAVGVSITGEWPPLRDQKAGLLFNFADARNFDFFGVYGDLSAWVLASCRDGKLGVEASRGRCIELGKEYGLSVRTAGEGIECRVNGELVMRAPRKKMGAGALAILVAGKPAQFKGLSVSPPAGFEVSGEKLVLPAGATKADLVVRASDGDRSSEKPVSIPLRAASFSEMPLRNGSARMPRPTHSVETQMGRANRPR